MDKLSVDYWLCGCSSPSTQGGRSFPLAPPSGLQLPPNWSALGASRRSSDDVSTMRRGVDGHATQGDAMRLRECSKGPVTRGTPNESGPAGSWRIAQPGRRSVETSLWLVLLFFALSAWVAAVIFL